MFSRTFLFSSARGVLLVHSRCSQATLLEGGWIPLTGRGTAIAPFSISSVLRDTPSKPGKSGDKGPEKNYRKKILKKQKKEIGQQPPPPGSDLDALLKEMKLMETQPQAQSVPAGHIASLMKGASGGNVGARRPMLNQRTDGAYAGRNNMQSSRRGRQNAAGKSVHAIDSHLHRLKGKGMAPPINFADPSSGKRLGWFNHPKPGTNIMPPAKPTLIEQDELKGLQELFLLKPATHFEEQMTDTMTTTVRYERTFPVDNDDYFKDHDEAHTGFEEHVLLDHLLEEFPKKGPVRHFMELVVTGLSKNPHYTASEKRECVQWYRDYFNEFTSTELQSL